MRGRKINTNFVSNFILECNKKGLSNSDDILLYAIEEISKIDNQLKQIDQLKKRRSELFDVKLLLEKNNNKNNNINIDFFKVRDKMLALNILSLFESKAQHESLILDKLSNFNKEDIVNCINQLKTAKVIYKQDNYDLLYLGSAYKKFVKFLNEYY
jgi:DNA repair ATPase RecN